MRIVSFLTTVLSIFIATCACAQPHLAVKSVDVRAWPLVRLLVELPQPLHSPSQVQLLITDQDVRIAAIEAIACERSSTAFCTMAKKDNTLPCTRNHRPRETHLYELRFDTEDTILLNPATSFINAEIMYKATRMHDIIPVDIDIAEAVNFITNSTLCRIGEWSGVFSLNIWSNSGVLSLR